jgi:ATP-dependent helicase HrpB
MWNTRGVTALPIDPYVARILQLARDRRAVIVTAAPGAGKTTRVAPALATDGPVVLLQPRRVAARAIARRIADERGWTLGREVGWHVRFERRSSPDTRVLVATEGILTARLQHDPLLSGVHTVVIDEFHERSLHGDLALALSRQAWLARPDLRLVVMSATIDAAPVAAFLDGCPVVDVPGRTFPLDVTYQPNVAVEQTITAAAARTSGALLCFLPGAPEIRRTAEILSTASFQTPVVMLYGALDADAQDAALRPTGERRIVLATNLAETTVTVPDVTAVIDTGLQKVARFDPDRGIDALETERISQDSADQRAGRAGRTQAGIAIRLWDARDRLRPHREPEIARVDLAGAVLDVLAWGGNPATFEWFERPRPERLDAALELLRRLGATDTDGRLTPTGHSLRQLSLHPRLGRLLLAASGAPVAARACAFLSEPHVHPRPADVGDRRRRHDRAATTTCDLLAAVEVESALPPHVRRASAALLDRARDVLGRAAVDRIDDESFRHALLAAYPDRVARRREPGSDRLLLASGTGARQARESGVHRAEFLVAVDVAGASGVAGSEALVRIATGIERDWISPTSREMRHELDPARGVVRAAVVERYDSLILSEHPVAPDPAETARLIVQAYVTSGPKEEDAQLMRRLTFAGLDADFESLVNAAAPGVSRLDDVDLEAPLPSETRRRLARGAPATLRVPSGREVRLDYRSDGAVVAAVKLQELFGLSETPRLGPSRTPLTFELLAPNGRPVQVTSDLSSFWRRGYAEVRKELRARYPKHPWPEDPWTARPTARTLKR